MSRSTSVNRELRTLSKDGDNRGNKQSHPAITHSLRKSFSSNHLTHLSLDAKDSPREPLLL